MTTRGVAALAVCLALAAGGGWAANGNDDSGVSTGVPRAITLAGREVAAPADLAPRSLVVVSFHRAANQSAREWRGGLDDDPRAEDWSAYSVIVLEGAPKMIRSLVVRGLRGDVPAERQGSFLVVEEGADAWRTLAGSNGENEDRDDAVFVARLEDGAVCARYRGVVSPAALDALFSAACIP